jgi:hypothetical protein
MACDSPGDRYSWRMFTMSRPVLGIVASLLALEITSGAAPLQLHPENGHYFLFHGKPTILITSGEHYGAVLNLDVDYVRYLNELQRAKLNLTRTFSGAYVEPQGAFNIESNIMAPAAGRFICPWERSSTPGYAKGGGKFDLDRWDPAYFKRLKDFVHQADRRGIVVEMNLFCPIYEEIQWTLSPQNAANNINNVGAVARTNVYTLDKSGGLLAVQERMVRKIVTELNGFDNVYYEICNEPYFGGVTLEWQHHIADVITETERGLPKKHLISRNVANGSQKIENPHPAISIFNFHYASPPDAVTENYHLNKVIGDNETGFRGTSDAIYRMEAWQFILAGGGLFNNLDYSFVVGHEDGTFVYPVTQPGGGNRAYRNQLTVLRDFMREFDFIHARFGAALVKSGVPPEMSATAFSEGDRKFGVYVGGKSNGTDAYSVRWTGQIEAPEGGEYQFFTVSNDGVKLWIDGRLVLENWTGHSAKEDSAMVKLERGSHEIRIDYFQAGGGAEMKLSWKTPGGAKEIVPKARLKFGGREGLRGEYFVGANFEDRRFERFDSGIDFVWTNHSPFDADKSGGARSLNLSLDLPSGNYKVTWVDPVSGKRRQSGGIKHSGGPLTLETPAFSEDLAFRIERR